MTRLELFPGVVSYREGAIDRLVNIYKDVVHKTGVSIITSLSTASIKLTSLLWR